MKKLYSIVLLFSLMILGGACAVDAQSFTNIDGQVIFNQIRPGGTIFLGEEHLDLQTGNCLNGNGFVVTLAADRSTVTDQIRIDNPGDFTYPMDKGAAIWYQSADGANPVLNAAGEPVVAFVSAVPNLEVKIWNGDTDTEVTDSVSRQQLIRFKFGLDSNLDAVTDRLDWPGFSNPGASYINMALYTPSGEQLLDLVTLNTATGNAGTTSLLNIGPDPTALPPDDFPLANWMWPANALPSNTLGWWAGIRDNEAGVQGGYRYPLGAYTLVAVCNLNNMLNNNKALGQTYTETPFQLTESPLTLVISPLEVPKVRNTTFTATISGLPNHQYDLFIYDDCPGKLTGQICDRPPFIVGDRAALARQGITLDPLAGPYAIGDNRVVDCCKEDMTIRQLTPSGDQFPSRGDWEIFESGTRYYATVTTGNDGTATVPFWIDTTIGEGVYRIQVQDTLAQQKAKAEVTVNLGTITLAVKDAKGTDKTDNPVFSVGDEIWIEGTNSDSDVVHMWITGPGLDPCGVNLNNVHDSIRIPSPDSTIVDSQILQNYWRLNPNWMTNETPFGPGEYTVWVYSDDGDGRYCRCNEPGCEFCNPDACFGNHCETGLCELQKCPECIPFANITVTLKEPSLEAEIDDVTRCCCPGADCGLLGGTEKFILNGTSYGNYPKELRIWLFAPGQVGNLNYLINQEPVYCDDTFTYDMNRGILHPSGIDLCQMTPGTYDVIVQAPGMNGMFDVRLGEILTNRDRFVLTTLPTQESRLFAIEGKNALFGQEALKGLMKGLDQDGIDDLYVHERFVLSDKPCDGNLDFTADRNTGNVPLTVKFTDTSRVEGVEWQWSANGVVFSNETSPVHTFDQPGKYTISMEVTARGKSTPEAPVVKQWFINVLSGPESKFTYLPGTPYEGTAVQFLDESEGSPTSWEWDFGDGTTSSLQSPAHTYETAGKYLVSLRTGNAMGVGVPFTKEVSILSTRPTPGPTPVGLSANFGYEQIGPKTLKFTDQSVGTPVAWVWDFMDGVISYEQNPVHEFLYAQRYYTVTLTVSDGSTSSMKQIALYVE